MIRTVAVASLAAVAIAAMAGALPGGPQDPWAAEKKDPKFADVDWDYKGFPPNEFLNAMSPGGPILYTRYCIHCHGEKGDGRGDMSPMLIPPPRDFTKGIFKGRSSHPEMPPTQTDLMRSLIHGIPLSGMLSYSFMDVQQQVALIAHVKNLADGHFPKGFGFPLKSGNFHRDAGMPFPTPETLSRGRALFDRFSCLACHGEKGDGRGRVTDTLSDSVAVHGGMEFERPSSVRDFTQGIYSGGPNVRHMYLRVSGGVQGTVMPPFATSASVEDRWALTHYVMSLSKRSAPLPLPHSEVMIVKKEKKVPTKPDDPMWEALRKLEIPPKEMGPFSYEIQPVYVLDLYLQQLRHNKNRPYFTEANARAIHDGTDLSIRVEWEDSAHDPGDRIEVQLTKHLPPGFVLYGNPLEPVNLWRWEAKTPAAAPILDATGPFAIMPRAAAAISTNAAYDAKSKRWAVVFTRSIAGAGGPDVPIQLGNFNPFSILMKDGSEAWPQGTREIKPDPEDDADTVLKAKDKETARLKMEKDVETQFKDLPRHLTTWHMMRME